MRLRVVKRNIPPLIPWLLCAVVFFVIAWSQVVPGKYALGLVPRRSTPVFGWPCIWLVGGGDSLSGVQPLHRGRFVIGGAIANSLAAVLVTLATYVMSRELLRRAMKRCNLGMSDLFAIVAAAACVCMMLRVHFSYRETSESVMPSVAWRAEAPIYVQRWYGLEYLDVWHRSVIVAALFFTWLTFTCGCFKMLAYGVRSQCGQNTPTPL